MIRILLVDDEALLREGLRAILEVEDDLEIVGEAADGAEAISMARSLQPDVILMDIRMPGTDGLEATRRILAFQPDLRIIVLTTFDHDEYVYAALKAGASGFLLKDLRRRELLDAVRAGAEGGTLLARSVTTRLIERFCQPAAPASETLAALSTLTGRETEVLVLVARGLRNAEIGERLFLGENTVKTHVARVMAKLGLRDRVQAVIVAYEAGLVRAGES